MPEIVDITDAGHDLAVELLSAGFPQRSRDFWQEGVARLSRYCRDHNFNSIGSFLMAKGKPVGILLKIPSKDPKNGATVANLSSWYVEEKYRWYAAKMLMDATADEGVIYTDFTPSEEAMALNEKLGFRTIATGMLLVVLPLAALIGRSSGRAIAPEQVPVDAFSASQWDAIQSHVLLGCIVLALKIDETYHPIILDVVRKRNIPVARVLYAENSSLLRDNIKPIARYLLKRGIPVLSVLAEKGHDIGHAVTWRSEHHYQVKGVWPDNVINELYSERVFLKV
jgi:hypothetical protein